MTENNNHCYAHNFVDQKFGLRIVRVAYFCIMMTEVSAGVLKWQEMVETAPLKLHGQGLGSTCRLGSLLLPHVVSGGVGMFKRASSVLYFVFGLGWMAWSWSGISLCLSVSLSLSRHLFLLRVFPHVKLEWQGSFRIVRFLI